MANSQVEVDWDRNESRNISLGKERCVLLSANERGQVKTEIFQIMYYTHPCFTDEETKAPRV